MALPSEVTEFVLVECRDRVRLIRGEAFGVERLRQARPLLAPLEIPTGPRRDALI